MCIRDRLYSPKTGKTYDGTIVLADTGGKYVNYRISVQRDREVTPVSYTHLDVYKRQLYGRISFALKGRTDSSVQRGDLETLSEMEIGRAHV